MHPTRGDDECQMPLLMQKEADEEGDEDAKRAAESGYHHQDVSIT